MQTASVRELRNHYNTLLDRVAEGEEIVITKRGKPVARLVPDTGNQPEKVDWSQSVAMRDRAGEKMMSEEQLQALWDELDG